MWLLSVLLFAVVSSAAAQALLSAYALEKQPWLNQPAWSRRLPPVFTGQTPVELSKRKMSPAGSMMNKAQTRNLPEYMKKFGENFIPEVEKVLGRSISNVTMEIYPAYDDDDGTGLYTWVFARLYENGDWKFLPSKSNHFNVDRVFIPPPVFNTKPIFPQVLDPAIKNESMLIFDPAYMLPDLYAQPLFGNCIWQSKTNGSIVFAWLNAENQTLVEQMKSFTVDQNLECVVLPPPSRFQDTPETW